jgi:hypothetical protein
MHQFQSGNLDKQAIVIAQKAKPLTVRSLFIQPSSVIVPIITPSLVVKAFKEMFSSCPTPNKVAFEPVKALFTFS